MAVLAIGEIIQDYLCRANVLKKKKRERERRGLKVREDNVIYEGEGGDDRSRGQSDLI